MGFGFDRSTTGATPFKLVYGHEVVFPIEINLNLIQLQRQNEFPIHVLFKYDI